MQGKQNSLVPVAKLIADLTAGPNMNTATFDTLSAARSLEAAGIQSQQAEAIVGAIRSSGEASVTKTDLQASTNELRGEMKALAAELRGRDESYGRRAARRDQLRREQDAACPTRHCRIAVCGNQVFG